MYGAELTVVPGGGEETIGILKDSSADKSRCVFAVARSEESGVSS
jgi:hypothetical protein